MCEKIILLPGDCLFENHAFGSGEDAVYFMKEDRHLCTRFRYHQQKIVLFLASMRLHAGKLRSKGCRVHYQQISENPEESYFESLLRFARDNEAKCVHTYEVSDHFFREELRKCCRENGLQLVFAPNPSFINSGEAFREFLQESRPFMHNWYVRERKRLGILTDSSGSPEGNKWSFDAENRKALPPNMALPENYGFDPCPVTRSVIQEVEQAFASHPGKASEFRWATRPEQARIALTQFIEQRLGLFGPYEDAIHDREVFLFHSALSPLMNLGLITPSQVLDAVLCSYRQGNCSLASAEGFVRQVIGWREFIKGCYENLDFSANYFGHRRRLKPCWYDGTTGIQPIDNSIGKALRYGYTHHIERLMILGNAMLLCRVNPDEVYRWFMEMFVDSADWVMVPNVFGMSQFADGGQFATKPYIGGSNYILKMSNYAKKADWCEVFDGLYWKFVCDNRELFGSNVRTSMMVKNFEKIDPVRKERIFGKAMEFIENTTCD